MTVISDYHLTLCTETKSKEAVQSACFFIIIFRPLEYISLCIGYFVLMCSVFAFMWCYSSVCPTFILQNGSGEGDPYRRKFLSPTASLMSSSSSIVAFTAKSAALWWSEPWLDPTSSLLMPPTGSCLLVRSNDPPWLHLPWSRQNRFVILFTSVLKLGLLIVEQTSVHDSSKSPAGFAEEKMLK